MSGRPVPPVRSPCIRVCRQDDAAGFCTGCGRTVIEVVCWATMSQDGRSAIMAALPARLEQLRVAAEAGPPEGG